MTTTIDVTVGPLLAYEVDAADRIFRLAFGTRVGLPDPMRFNGDADLIQTRYKSDHVAALGARLGGELVGSSFASNWGSMAMYGPLSVRPDLWNRGVAQRLLEPTMELFAGWDSRYVGLFTPADSPKHVALYQRFGFWPRFLIALMAKPVTSTAGGGWWSRYSQAVDGEHQEYLGACREVTDSIYEGLDLAGEIRSVAVQRLGDTLLLRDGSRLAGFAVCHWGPSTEAGSGVCYVKFGAVRAGPRAGEAFDHLLQACEALAAAEGMQRLVAGVNTARHDAYLRMLGRGFRTFNQGVSMHRPDDPGYDRAEIYAMDDWR